MFEINEREELDEDNKENLEKQMNITLPDNATSFMLTVNGTRNRNGFIANDGTQVFPQGIPRMKYGLPAVNARAFGNNGVGGFISGPSMDKSSRRVILK